MKQLTELSKAAAAARDDLSLKMESAASEAERSMAEARGRLDNRQELIRLVTEAEKIPGSEAANIIGTYAGIINRPKADAKLLIQSLSTAAHHYGLSAKQAGQIAKAIMAHIHGNAPSGLVEWPSLEEWATMLHDKALRAWAAWVAPDALQQIEKLEAKASEDYATAEVVLLRLKKARAALDDIVVPAGKPKNILIRNHSKTQVGLSGLGISFAGDEVQPLGFAEYARLVDHQGFQHMRDQNILEVLA